MRRPRLNREDPESGFSPTSIWGPRRPNRFPREAVAVVTGTFAAAKEPKAVGQNDAAAAIPLSYAREDITTLTSSLEY
jgi:hypothetical protein